MNDLLWHAFVFPYPTKSLSTERLASFKMIVKSILIDERDIQEIVESFKVRLCHERREKERERHREREREPCGVLGRPLNGLFGGLVEYFEGLSKACLGCLGGRFGGRFGRPWGGAWGGLLKAVFEVHFWASLGELSPSKGREPV